VTLRVEESQDGGRNLRGIFLRTTDGRGHSLAATAATGQFLRSDDPDVILLRLENGTLVHEPGGSQPPRVLAFAQHDLPINLPPMTQFRARGDGSVELSIPELARISSDPSAASQMRRQAAATLHRRLIQCVVLFVLPFLAVALAVPPKRSTSALGVFLSVVLLVSYHKLTEYGERMAGIGRVDPLPAQWVPFALFAAFCLWVYHVLAHRPGGQPIGALDRWFAGLAKWLAALIGRRRRILEDVPVPAG
jgi:lipopolysaccharide export system permease protein